MYYVGNPKCYAGEAEPHAEVSVCLARHGRTVADFPVPQKKSNFVPYTEK